MRKVCIFLLIITACNKSNDNRTYTWVERPRAGIEFGNNGGGDTFHKYASVGFATNVDLLITGIPDGYSAAIYSDSTCSTQITLPKEIMGDTVFDAVSVVDGNNNFYAKVTTDDEDPQTICVQAGNYHKANIGSFEIAAEEGALTVSWQTDVSVPGLDAKAKLLDGIDTVIDFESISFNKTYLNLADEKIYSVTLKLTDKDGFSMPLITKSKRPLDISNATSQILRTDGKAFISNPGFSKSGILRVGNITSGDFIGVYFSNDCLASPVISDYKVTSSSTDVSVDFDDITNVFYIKRRPRGMSLFSCVPTSPYDVSNATITPKITPGNVDYSVQLTIPQVVGIVNPVYEYSKKIGENAFSSYIVSNSGALPFENIGSQTTYQVKVRIKDGDGAYSDEFTGSVFPVDVLPPSPCDGLAGGAWIYVPRISDEIGPNLTNRLANWNGQGIGLRPEDGVGPNGFCVTKYPLKDSGSGLASQAEGDVFATNYKNNKLPTTCSEFLPGARLLTNAEWMMIALNIEAQPENWIDKTTGEQTTPGAANGYISRGRYFNGTGDFQFHQKRETHFIKNGFYGDKATINDMLDSGTKAVNAVDGQYWIMWDTKTQWLTYANLPRSGTEVPNGSYPSLQLSLKLVDTAMAKKSNLLPQTVLDGHYTDASGSTGGLISTSWYSGYNSRNRFVVRGNSNRTNFGSGGLFRLDPTRIFGGNTSGNGANPWSIRCAYVLP